VRSTKTRLFLFVFGVCALKVCDSGILLYTQFLLALSLRFADASKTSKIPFSHLKAFMCCYGFLDVSYLFDVIPFIIIIIIIIISLFFSVFI